MEQNEVLFKLNKDIEKFDLVSYFIKLYDYLERFIINCLIKNYYSLKVTKDARSLLKEIFIELNIFIYGTIHYEYFYDFESSLKRYKYISDKITNFSSALIILNSDNKKKNLHVF